MNNDNIKIINISNKKSNIIENDNYNNRSVNEIIFSNDENNDDVKDFILDNNNSVVIEENVAIEDKDKIYKDDIVYFQELENQLLSTYPVTQQGSKFILDKIKNDINNILETKNLGIQKYSMIKENIEYKILEEVKNNIFDTFWIIPIVNDIHNIFSEVGQVDENLINDNEDKFALSKSREDISGIKEINQKDLLNELKNNKFFIFI